MLGKYDRAIQRRIVELEEQLQTLLPKEAALKEEVSSKRQKAEEAKSSAQSTRSRNELLTRLMAQKKRGNLKGVFVSFLSSRFIFVSLMRGLKRDGWVIWARSMNNLILRSRPLVVLSSISWSIPPRQGSSVLTF